MLSQNKKLLEASTTVDLNFKFVKLFEKLNPLKSVENERLFKIEFEKELQQILRAAA